MVALKLPPKRQPVVRPVVVLAVDLALEPLAAASVVGFHAVPLAHLVLLWRSRCSTANGSHHGSVDAPLLLAVVVVDRVCAIAVHATDLSRIPAPTAAVVA